MYRYILFYKPCTIYTPPPLTDARTFGARRRIKVREADNYMAVIYVYVILICKTLLSNRHLTFPLK